MVIDPHDSFSDYRNYKHMSEAKRRLRQNIRRIAEEWSSFTSVRDLEQIDPYYVGYARFTQAGDPQQVQVVIQSGGPTYEIDLPRGSITGMFAGEKTQAVIRNSRGNRWMFEYYVNQYNG